MAKRIDLLPAKIEAARVISEYGVTDPRDIDLEGIAFDLGFIVTSEMIRGADARLVRGKKVGVITISSRISYEPQRRFAGAHELGRGVLHKEESQAYLCTTDDLQDYERSELEAQANTFSGHFLMPAVLMNREYAREDPSILLLDKVASEFRVSRRAAAGRHARARRILARGFVSVRCWTSLSPSLFSETELSGGGARIGGSKDSGLNMARRSTGTPSA